MSPHWVSVDEELPPITKYQVQYLCIVKIKGTRVQRTCSFTNYWIEEQLDSDFKVLFWEKSGHY